MDAVIKSCRNCEGEKVQVLRHILNGKNLGYRVTCNNCGFTTKDYQQRAEAIHEWNEPTYLKGGNK